MTDTINKIKLATESIKLLNEDLERTEQKRQSLTAQLVQLENERAAVIGEVYSLSSLLGQTYIRHRTKWGMFDDSNRIEVFDEKSLGYFSHLKPHAIKDGAYFNRELSTNFFKEDKQYVLYVEYYFDEWDDYEQQKDTLAKTPFDNREIYEYLIFEI